MNHFIVVRFHLGFTAFSLKNTLVFLLLSLDGLCGNSCSSLIQHCYLQLILWCHKIFHKIFYITIEYHVYQFHV